MSRILSAIVGAALEAYVRFERRMLAILLVLLALSFSVLLYRFYGSNTMLVPAAGGTYIEGSVGDLQPLNPWFRVTNDVNRDLLSLIFFRLLQ